MGFFSELKAGMDELEPGSTDNMISAEELGLDLNFGEEIPTEAAAISSEDLGALLDNIDGNDMAFDTGSSDTVPIGDINAMMEAAGEMPIQGMDGFEASMDNIEAMVEDLPDGSAGTPVMDAIPQETMVFEAELPEQGGFDMAAEMPAVEVPMDMPLEAAMDIPVEPVESAVSEEIDIEQLSGLSDIDIPTPMAEEPVAAAPVTENTSMNSIYNGGNGMAMDETALITLGMNIVGDITSEGSLEFLGTITGNIAIRGKLNVTGTINGNSKAAEIYADNAKITGDVASDGSVKLGQGTVVIGNVSANSAVIAGAVKGDIDVHGPVILDTSAIVMGNIKSKSVQINNGAVIEGMCSQAYADVSPTSFFDELKKGSKK